MSFTNPHTNEVPNSPWKKPNEIMALHRLKVKKRALQARFKKPTSTNNQNLDYDPKDEQYNKFMDRKRRNPFARSSDSKRFKENISSTTEDASNDNTLFKLLNMSMSDGMQINQIPVQLPNIANTITELSKNDKSEEVSDLSGYNFIPIDWTVKTKMRIISKNKFKWSSKLRTSEEASGITGFVRCLDTTTSESLDTSMSARSYQCCLVWQHPSLPWLPLFPRLNVKSTSNGPSLVVTHPTAVKALHSDWVESFRSLFQLLRAKQCPYFYFCANTFTILFRAAGICGFTDIHALVTPTTRGFRQTLKQEDIEYTMPLKKSRRSADHLEDLGYETLDSNIDDSSPVSSNSSLRQNDDNNDFIVEDGDDDDEDVENDRWLKSLGVDVNEIKKINDKQARKNQTQECIIDNSDESLIFVEGVEAQALFNFLLNCKSAISVVGPLAGIPPTLLSPVAFRGAALQSLKIRESIVTADDSEYHSLIVSGPILPNNVHSLANLISSPEDEYSATFENIKTTSSFSKVHTKNKGGSTETENDNGSNVFLQENLTDCGLSKKMIKHLCSSDTNHMQVIESLKFIGKDHLYYWT